MKGADAPRDSVATDNGRFYEWKGERFISVTNVLDRVISKPVLVPWAAKLVAEYAKAHPGADIKEWKRQPKLVKETSADRGTVIHAWCEQFFLNPELALDSIPPEYAAECVGFVQAIEHHGIVPIAAEATVYSRAYGYAGTNDLFAELGGVPILADIKTSKRVYPEYALQLAAYGNAEFIGLADGTEVPLPEVQDSFILHVDHGTTRLIPMFVGQAEFRAFLNAVELASWLVNDSKNAIGKEAV